MMAVHPEPHVLAAVDGSTGSNSAVAWAAREAEYRHQSLLLAHVSEVGSRNLAEVGSGPTTGAVPHAYREQIEEAARELLADAAQTAAEVAPGVTLDTTYRFGLPADQLLELSESASVVVLGATGRGGFHRMLLGSVGMSVASRAEVPVVVARTGADGRLPESSYVLVGVDGSPTSEKAIAAAFAEASIRQVDLIAVAALNLQPGAYPIVYHDENVRARERAVLAERVAGWGEMYPDVRVRQELVVGHPAHTLLEYSEHAQLVVVGSRGRGEITGLILGSVSRALIHHATCPVMVTRPDKD